MDDSQVRSKLLENGDRGGLVIDKDAALAVGGDFTANDDLRLVGIHAVGGEHLGHGFGRDLENGRDYRSLASVANDIAGGFFTEQQREGVDENRFAGAGFTGQQIQSRAEGNHDRIDDRIVFNSELDQHWQGSKVSSFKVSRFKVSRFAFLAAWSRSTPIEPLGSLRLALLA